MTAAFCLRKALKCDHCEAARVPDVETRLTQLDAVALTVVGDANRG